MGEISEGQKEGIEVKATKSAPRLFGVVLVEVGFASVISGYLGIYAFLAPIGFAILTSGIEIARDSWQDVLALVGIKYQPSLRELDGISLVALFSLLSMYAVFCVERRGSVFQQFIAALFLISATLLVFPSFFEEYFLLTIKISTLLEGLTVLAELLFLPFFLILGALLTGRVLRKRGRVSRSFWWTSFAIGILCLIYSLFVLFSSISRLIDSALGQGFNYFDFHPILREVFFLLLLLSALHFYVGLEKGDQDVSDAIEADLNILARNRIVVSLGVALALLLLFAQVLYLGPTQGYILVLVVTLAWSIGFALVRYVPIVVIRVGCFTALLLISGKIYAFLLGSN